MISGPLSHVHRISFSPRRCNVHARSLPPHRRYRQLGTSTNEDNVKSIRELFLPPGYPSSVSEDYLVFQLWSLPTHISGWTSLSLSTSSLLKAVSYNMTNGDGAATAAAAAAVGGIAIAASSKWLIKDGIGSLGRVLVSSLGPELDDDPRRWRMIAEILSSIGLGLEVSTSFFPLAFLPLAALGNFLKAIGRGMSKPAFRVIQGHLARANNVGAVSAKEEVWEVVGQLLGLLSAVVIIEAFKGQGEGSVESTTEVAVVWVAVQLSHVFFRRQALGLLYFRTLNRKRACLLISSHVKGFKLGSIEEVNQQEPLWASGEVMRPCVKLGAMMEEVEEEYLGDERRRGGEVGAGSGWREVGEDLNPLVDLYQDEDYILSASISKQVEHGPKAFAAIKASAEGSEIACLKAIYQAAWIEHHSPHREDGPCPLEVLRESLEVTRRQWPKFVQEAKEMGWTMENVTMGIRDHHRVELEWDS